MSRSFSTLQQRRGLTRRFMAFTSGFRLISPRKLSLADHHLSSSFILSWCMISCCTLVSFGTYWAFSSSFRAIQPPVQINNNIFLERAYSKTVQEQLDPCEGKRIYMYDLPERFNKQVLKDCSSMVSWLSFCDHLLNHGFGRSVNRTSWYATDPYMLEVIFHQRMKRYSCLVDHPLEADALFIPYYAGLDALRYLYGAERKNRHEHGKELVRFLGESFPRVWRRRLGHDHFMVTGRTAWDFTSRRADVQSSWGTGLRLLQQMENVTTLVLERRPWVQQEQAIPYPTSFHPSSREELDEWIGRVHRSARGKLVSFVGASRPGQRDSIREILFQQCRGSPGDCWLMNCSRLRCSHNPIPIAEQLLSSVFCLQPPGDTFTRRSTFDSLLCGCVPVFFNVHSAYSQYSWHLPGDPSSFSVFISEDEVRAGLSVVGFLRSSVSRERIELLQSNVRKLIPRLLFVHPLGFAGGAGEDRHAQDAFDITVQEILKKNSRLRHENL